MRNQDIDNDVAELFAAETTIDACVVGIVFHLRQIVLKPSELEILRRQRYRQNLLVFRKFCLHIDLMRPFVKAIHVSEHLRALPHEAGSRQHQDRQ